MTLQGSVLSLDGEQCIKGQVSRTIADMTTTMHTNGKFLPEISSSCVIVPENLRNVLESSEQCGFALGEMLLSQGAAEILRTARKANEEH